MVLFVVPFADTQTCASVRVASQSGGSGDRQVQILSPRPQSESRVHGGEPGVLAEQVTVPADGERGPTPSYARLSRGSPHVRVKAIAVARPRALSRLWSTPDRGRERVPQVHTTPFVVTHS